MVNEILRELGSYLQDPDKTVTFADNPEAVVVSFDGTSKGQLGPFEIDVPLNALVSRLPTLGSNAAALFEDKEPNTAGLLLLASLIDEVAHDRRSPGRRGFRFTAEGKFVQLD